MVAFLGGCPLDSGGNSSDGGAKSLNFNVDRDDRGVVSVTSTNSQAVTVTRVVFNDRKGIYGCDFNENMNGKGNVDTSDIKSAQEFERTQFDFQRQTLHEGDSFNVTVNIGTGSAFCGNSIVKVEIETDQGTVSRNFN